MSPRPPYSPARVEPPPRDPAPPVPPSRHLAEWSPLVVTVAAVVLILAWAQEFWILLVVSVLASYALNPIVRWMQGRRIPRAVGAGLLVAGIVSGLGAFTYAQRDSAVDLIEQLPAAMQKLSRMLRTKSQGDDVIKQVQRAATELEKAATAATALVPPKGIPQIQVAEPGIKVRDYLWSGSVRAMTLAGELTLGIFLVYFLLKDGDLYKRKLIGLRRRRSMGQRRIAVRMLNNVDTQIQHYLLVVCGTSLAVAILTWLAFRWIGMAYAGLWGIAAGLFNVIPYLGPVVISAAAAAAAFLQFETVNMALLVAGIALVITGAEGFLVTPWLTGRASRINVVAIFVNLVFWGWIWGAWGVLLATPMLIVFKIVCDHVDGLAAVGAWLSADSRSGPGRFRKGFTHQGGSSDDQAEQGVGTQDWRIGGSTSARG